MAVTVAAHAKLNLSLDITGVRADGYHILEMVMQSVDLLDTVTISENDNGIKIISGSDNIPLDENNIAYIAAQCFFNTTDLKEQGVTIKIKKRIPVAAGLGGGSADAAAVLIGLNKLFQTNLSVDELCDIGLLIGADVPFCIKGGTQLAEGIGGILTPLPDLESCCFVIVKDGEKTSTGEMYKQFDKLNDISHPKTSLLVDAICEGNILETAKLVDNVFEPLWGENIAKIKNDLINNGALGAALSGSGPSVFGIFESVAAAEKCKAALDSDYDNIYVCKPVNFGTKID